MRQIKLINKVFYLKNYLLYFSVGVISAFSLPPFNLFPCIFFLSLGLFFFLKSNKPSGAFLIGLLIGFGWFSTSLYWISSSLIIAGREYYWMFPFTIIVFPLFLSLFWAISFYLSFKLSKYNDQRILLLIIIWTLIEYSRGIILSGFPWNMPGFSLSSNIFLSQTAAIVGIYGQNLLIILILTSPIFWLINNRKMALILLSIAVLTIVFSGLRIDKKKSLETETVVRLVQPSISIDDKWNKKLFKDNINKLTSLSLNDKLLPDIIIWPETAVTIFPELIIKELEIIAKKILLKNNSFLITGSITRKYDSSNRNYKYYNSILVIDNTGSVINQYDKMKLVPFGEYFPLRKLLPFIKTIVGEKDFSSGEKDSILVLKDIGNIKPIICYESIFPMKKKYNIFTDFILNITNDYWFGKSIGPEQHLLLTRNRAIETGLPVIRVANNGVSAIFDSYGREIKRLELDETSFLDVKVPKKLKETPYSKWSEKPMFLLIFLFIIQLIYKKFKRKVDPLNVF